MKFQKAEVELILFDNSDVIVTSPGDLAKCTSSQDDYLYCTKLGDSTKPNICTRSSNGYVCNYLWLIVPAKCNTSGNHDYFNAIGPGNPVDM